jgi:alkanesulfonate monooxygenase SsuD/methylene tetrahydromethanopterin reductase-like flavin-dependent oxidoreductase (luciferase family)
MQFGLIVQMTGILGYAQPLVRLAREAEAAGWDGFFIWDVFGGDAQVPTPMVDPWIALAAIATATERIRLGPMVTPLPRRRPWKLAREAASLDHLSGGRLILGVGIGDAPSEFSRFGEEADALTLEELHDMRAFIQQHRTTDAPFDVMVGGDVPIDDPVMAREILTAYAGAGVTWWIEGIGEWRGDVDAMAAFIQGGPPGR